MIAADTEREYIDEKEIMTYSRLASREKLQGNVVLQAPGMTYAVHHLAKHIPDLYVVMMLRDIDDIIRSQDRIGWRCEPLELRRYGLQHDEGPISAVKYNVWETQKEQITRYTEVRYEDLKNHPLWEADRKGWEWDRTDA
jgi:hypothetical protein